MEMGLDRIPTTFPDTKSGFLMIPNMPWLCTVDILLFNTFVAGHRSLTAGQGQFLPWDPLFPMPQVLPLPASMHFL